MGNKLAGKRVCKTGFSEIIKKAYEKGCEEQEITVIKLVEDLKYELQNILID